MFLGIDKSTWEFINSFSDWFSAIGTIAAVVVSLYLARGQSKLQLRITAGHRLMAGLGTGHFPDYLYISIVNTGFRKALVTGIGWKVGVFRKRYAIQITDKSPWSSPVPVELTDGQEAQYLVPFAGEADWLNAFAKDFLGKHPVLLSRFGTLQVFTSVGKTFQKRIEGNLREKLIEAARTQKKR